MGKIDLPMWNFLPNNFLRFVILQNLCCTVELLDQKVGFDETLYVDGDWIKKGWKTKFETLLGREISEKEWKKMRYQSVYVIATKEKVICIRLRKKTSKSVIYYAEIVTFKLENHYTWYSKFCIKFLNRIQMKVILDFEITDRLPTIEALMPLFIRIKNRFPEGKIQKIVSDEDKAIIGAVKSVFPEVAHSFCVFHQLKNVSKRYYEEFNSIEDIPAL